MTELLEKALERVQALDSDTQNRIAEAMIHIAEMNEVTETIDPEHLPDVLEGLRQAELGEFATDAEMERVWARFKA